ncbi:MAG: DUF4838 domain-containing protein [Clostridia bacterium]|nr:DUF4838 domain-containing protein [Clostridia bacterium]
MKKHGIVIHPEELTDRMIEILADTPINVLGLHPVGGASSKASLERLIELAKDEKFQENLTRVRSLGIKIEYEAHALAYLLPREMFADEPELFRMNAAGERSADYNLCVSNERALSIVSDRAESLSRILKSDTGRYYLWSDDQKDAFCCCPRCSRLTHSDQAMMIYNAILRGVRRHDPEAKCCYLAYSDAIEPPTSVKPDEGIFLEYAPIRRDTNCPLSDEGCEVNHKFRAVIAPLIEFFGKTDATALDYWLDNSLFSGWKKPPKFLEITPETVTADKRFYEECGFEAITTFACYLSDDYIDLYGTPPIKDYAEALNS